MGISILELVLGELREADIPAYAAFPGKRISAVTEPLAAVHLEKVDRAGLTVTVEVNVICPAQLGGTRCEMEALRATEVLCRAGASCIQHGCEYDGLAQVYVVRILADFTGITQPEDCTIGSGFRIFVCGEQAPFAVSFEAEQVFDVQALHEMGGEAPVGIRTGSWVWKLRLEELIPMGSPETEDPKPGFDVRVERDPVTETYCQCHWTSVRREFTRQGLRRIRTGISMGRQEERNG